MRRLLTWWRLEWEPNPLAATIHNRMPVILPPEQETGWLAPAPRNALELVELFRPCPDDPLEVYPVSRAVNAPALDNATLIEPIEKR